MISGDFRSLVREHCEGQGVLAPDSLQQYLADLLDQRIGVVDIIPDPSFAERYLQLYQYTTEAAYVNYADQCLFFCGLMPDYGRRRGLSLDYYATLGISAYYTAGDLSGDDRYTQLGNWFWVLQRVLDTLLHPRPLILADNWL
jgi:hypothetical protein